LRDLRIAPPGPSPYARHALDPTLRQRIRDKIMAGTLPGQPPLNVWAGVGDGHRCSACDAPIRASETEIELELGPGRPGVRLHRPCYAIWQEECDHR
jgi:hypothetical protein